MSYISLDDVIIYISFCRKREKDVQTIKEVLHMVYCTCTVSVAGCNRLWDKG